MNLDYETILKDFDYLLDGFFSETLSLTNIVHYSDYPNFLCLILKKEGLESDDDILNYKLSDWNRVLDNYKKTIFYPQIEIQIRDLLGNIIIHRILEKKDYSCEESDKFYDDVFTNNDDFATYFNYLKKLEAENE